MLATRESWWTVLGLLRLLKSGDRYVKLLTESLRVIWLDSGYTIVSDADDPGGDGAYSLIDFNARLASLCTIRALHRSKTTNVTYSALLSCSAYDRRHRPIPGGDVEELSSSHPMWRSSEDLSLVAQPQ
jgi:hypothetical protein